MFNANNGGYSLADIAAATGNNGGNNGMWGDGSWWIIILFLFIFAGWGGNGWNPGNGGGNAGAADNYVLASDFATLQRQLSDTTQSLERKGDAINNGLCDGFYAQNTTMLNGFNGVNQAIANSNYGIQDGMTQNRIAAMQDTNALTAQITSIGTQLASCCCDNRNQLTQSFADLNYNLASQNCQTRQAIADSTAAITASNDANTRSILAAIQDMQTQALQDKIATLTADNTTLKFAASQQAQNAYLINALNPTPIPAYPVPNPYAGYKNCGCGCGTI